jgi:hypothetical protein
MATRTKSFKIGEYAVGGIIKVTDKNGYITIDALDYNTKAKVKGRTFEPDANGMEVIEFLHELTSSYHVDKILEWLAY